MKKLTSIVLLLIAVATFSFFYLISSVELEEPHVPRYVTSAVAAETPNMNVRKFSSDKLNALAKAHDECQPNQDELRRDIDGIHHEIIKAMEYELNHGRTVRDILAYSNQYEIFYKGYEDLLLLARINIEKDKYDFTESVSILNQWKGLSVLKIFNSEDVETIIEELNRMKNISLTMSVDVEFAKNVEVKDLYELLENDKFNTYLESPLLVRGSPVLSPSILFVLNATKLNLVDYKKAISTRSFTVNDLAIAIKNNVPNEYIVPLFSQVSELADMPVTMQGDHDSYENIADVAVSQFNHELLAFLDKHGVKPTNQPGIITGMDIAIMNLPSARNYYTKNETVSEKHLQTLKYLAEQGYQAHGSIIQNEHEPKITFSAPYRRSFDIDDAIDPEVIKLLNKIELIDSRFDIEKMPPDQSLLSKALQVAKVRIEEQRDKGKKCESTSTEMLAEEGFVDIKLAVKIIEEIKKDEVNIPERLHDIDPFLVNLWRNSADTFRTVDPDQESRFTDMLENQQFQLALEYVLTKQLTIEETDVLLFLTLKEEKSDELLDIWNSRVSPVAPSGLLMFQDLPIAQWQQFLDGGFDFSIRDQFENDIFYAAALHSMQAVQFLLENGFSPKTDYLGLDVFDLLLDESYEQGRLNPAISPLLTVISHFEPSHYARIARLQKFFPAEYDKLVAINAQLALTAPTAINQFRFAYP
jgi:hypothetical protein